MSLSDVYLKVQFNDKPLGKYENVSERRWLSPYITKYIFNITMFFNIGIGISKVKVI